MKRQVYGDWELPLKSALDQMFQLVVESLDATDFADRFASHLQGRPTG
jgi:hypothetical protein